MTNLENDAVQEDIITEDNSYWVGQKQALARLETKAFHKTLIEEGYLKDYMFSLVMSLIDQGVVQNGQRQAVIEKLVGLARLRNYFDMLRAKGSTEAEYEEEYEEYYTKQVVKLNELNNAYEIAKQDADFKKVVSEGYMQEHAVREVSLLTNDQMVNAGHRGAILEDLAGVSVLTNFLVDLERNVGDEDLDEELED